MRSFVGAFDAIDKPKYTLRQSFELQEQGYPRVFSVPGAHVLTKENIKQTKRNYLMHNYFVKNNPVYCRSNPKRSYLHKKHKISHAQQRHSPSFVGVFVLATPKNDLFRLPNKGLFFAFSNKSKE